MRKPPHDSRYFYGKNLRSWSGACGSSIDGDLHFPLSEHWRQQSWDALVVENNAHNSNLQQQWQTNNIGGRRAHIIDYDTCGTSLLVLTSWPTTSRLLTPVAFQTFQSCDSVPLSESDVSRKWVNATIYSRIRIGPVNEVDEGLLGWYGSSLDHDICNLSGVLRESAATVHYVARVGNHISHFIHSLIENEGPRWDMDNVDVVKMHSRGW